MRRLVMGFLAMSMVFAFVACGSDGGNKSQLDMDAVSDLSSNDGVEELDVDLVGSQLVVETEVSANEVDVGDSVAITCMVTLDGEPMKLATEVHMSDGESETVLSEGEHTMNNPGEFEVWCALKSGDAVDETPENIFVQITGITSVETVVEPTTVPAGEIAVVTCTACNDAEVCQDWKKGIRSDPEVGVAVDGQEITGELVGSYQITCKGPVDAEINAVELTVVPGPADTFEASLDPAEVAAQESSEVSCTVTDAYGNAVADASWEVEVPEELTATGTQITGTVAGEYDVSCIPTAPNGEETTTPATLTVVGGAPVAVSFYIKPDKEFFAVGDKFTVYHEYIDQYGNEVGEAPINPIEVAPVEGMELTDNKDDRFVFVANGIYTLHVEASEMTASKDLQVLCDSTGPQILITYPPRAANLTGPTALTVTGTVIDAVGNVASVTVNDQEVPLGSNGGFSLDMTLTHGMNLVSVVAVDQYGNSSKAFRSAFYSTDWVLADAAEPLAGLIPDSLVAFLTQEFLDDGDHSLPADDLATVAELMIGGMDLSTLLPEGGIAFGNNCSAVINSVTYDLPTISLQSMDQTIYLSAGIPNIVVDLDLECCYEVPYIGEYCDPYYGTIYIGEVYASAYLFVSADGTGDIDASLGPIEADVADVEIDIQGMTGNLLDPFINLLIDTLKDGLIAQVQEQFGEQIPAAVDSLVASLQEGMPLALPALIGDGPGAELILTMVIRELLFGYDGLSLGGDIALTSAKAVDHDPLGVLVRDGCMGTEPSTYDLPTDSEVNLAVAVDFINEALFSVWYSGLLTLELTEEALGSVDLTSYGLENLAATVDMYYPPVLETCGTGGALKLQLGDAFLHATFDMMGMHWDIDIFLFMVMDASLTIVEEDGVKKIGLEFGDLEVAEIEVADVGPELKGKESMVENLFATVVLPLLTDQLLGGLGGIEVPAIDMSTIVDGIPPGTTLSVDLETLAVDNGYLLIGGKLK